MSIQSDILGAVNSIAGFTLGARSVEKMDKSNKRVDELRQALDAQNEELKKTRDKINNLAHLKDIAEGTKNLSNLKGIERNTKNLYDLSDIARNTKNLYDLSDMAKNAKTIIVSNKKDRFGLGDFR